MELKYFVAGIFLIYVLYSGVRVSDPVMIQFSKTHSLYKT